MFGEINQYTSDVDAEYRAIVLKANKRYSNGWMLECLLHLLQGQGQQLQRARHHLLPLRPVRPVDISWGPSNFDTTHKIVVSATYELPSDILVSGIAYYAPASPTPPWTAATPMATARPDEFALVDATARRYAATPSTSPTTGTSTCACRRPSASAPTSGSSSSIDMFNVTNEDN